MFTIKRLRFLVVLSIFIVIFFFSTKAFASTSVSGTISIDAVWTSNDSPYIVSNLLINSGVTLTINPGVIIKFQDQNSSIDVNGTLHANGTSADKVYFTSIKDDSVGGDTNGDGNTTVPISKNWRNIKFNFGSVGFLSNVVVRYAGSTSGTGIYNNGANLTISDSVVTDNGDRGILNFGGTLNVTSSEISNQVFGVNIFNGTANISSNNIHDNSHYGIILQNNSNSLTLTNNTFTNNAVAAVLLPPQTNFIHSGNTATGVGFNGFNINGVMSSDHTWKVDGMPYFVNGDVIVNSGVTLDIDPDVIVKFSRSSYIEVSGTLNVRGISAKKVFFTSIKDDSVGGDTNGDGTATTPGPQDWRYIKFNNGSIGSIANAVTSYAGANFFIGIYNNGGNLTITNSVVNDNSTQGFFQSGGSSIIASSEFSNQTYGIHRSGGIMSVAGSSIKNNLALGILNDGSGTINAQNNYWGDPSGPFHSVDNPGGLGNGVSANVLFNPWCKDENCQTSSSCAVDCFSNVLFLPGLMGSQLYDSGIDCGPGVHNSVCGEQQRWVSTKDSSHKLLFLQNDGTSIMDTYTKNDTQKLAGDNGETGIIEEINLNNLPDPNTYKSFLTDLKKWKDDDKIIADYAFIPYDWRLSLDNIITNGAASPDGKLSYTHNQNFSESFILKKLDELQKTSRTGKVTIIAHSNGGLVAKALVQKLKDTNNPLYNKIDKIILVAVPQLGTPEALITVLHGTGLGHGFIMSQKTSREFAENMPAIYNLLPSASYFTTVDPGFAVDKPISFPNTPFFQAQTSQYGTFVSNETELKNYILGTDGRTKPSTDDTVHPNIANSLLYDQAENMHQILDAWQPSPNTKVIQVAGWGEETLAGLDYESIKDTTEHLSYKPRMVVDGDGTVVVPSALWMSDSSPNVERWWVNLAEEGGSFSTDREHGDIFELKNLRDFLKSKIADSTFTDPDKLIVNNTSTLITDKFRLHYTLHSPLTLGITDAQGRYTGMDPVTKEIKQEIPDVDYRQIGDVQFISAPAGITYTLKLKGYQPGNFSLDVEKQEGNNITASTSFQAIPSSTSTIATMNVAPNFSVDTSTLKIDQNGDGVVDKTMQATPNGKTIYDATSPELIVKFDTNTKDVALSAQDNIDPNPTVDPSGAYIILKDSSGNTTLVLVTKVKLATNYIKLTFNRIMRNGVVSIIPNASIVYSWQEKNNVLTDLETRVTIKGLEKYVFNYKKANDVTIVRDNTGLSIAPTTKPGFVGVTIKTDGDSIKVDY